MHLRWELYPVPHERADRVSHGGSYFEESDWWSRPRERRLRGEFAVMIPEILFLKALREHNPALWRRSFPFHFGLYLLAGAALGVLVARGGRAARWHGMAGRRGRPAGALDGCGDGLGGPRARRVRRARAAPSGGCRTRRCERSPPPETSSTCCSSWRRSARLAPATSRGRRARPTRWRIAIGMLSWDAAVRVPSALAAGLVATAALVAYIPLTHMSHFIGKYFTYHAVRWDDAPLGDDPEDGGRAGRLPGTAADVVRGAHQGGWSRRRGPTS